MLKKLFSFGVLALLLVGCVQLPENLDYYPKKQISGISKDEVISRLSNKCSQEYVVDVIDSHGVTCSRTSAGSSTHPPGKLFFRFNISEVNGEITIYARQYIILQNAYGAVFEHNLNTQKDYDDLQGTLDDMFAGL